MFHRKLLEQDWNHVNDNFDLDTAVNSLHSTLEKLMNECFPRKSIRMSSRDPPWMSPLVKSLLKKKKTRSRKGGGRDLTELTEKIGRLIAENRRALASGKLGSRAWWRKVDRLSMRKDKCSSDPDKDFIIGLNDYFGDICFDREYSKPVPAEIDVNTPAPQLSTFQVFLALSRIKRTATGPDGIPFWIWKDYAEIFTPVIENLWNLSLARQIWPSRWKEANINPLPKVETPVEYADFRGINVTPVIARTFERTVYNIFNKRCLEEYLNNSQFAYRSGGSCVNALLKMQHTFLAALDKRDTVAVRMFTMDFSKAFDNVKHNLLVEKLKHSPLDSFIVNWYANFLEGRKQRVIFNNLTCQWKIVNKGTTQGSVSGPYLFNIFLNDLEIDGYKDISLFKYADDSTVLVTITKDSPDISDIALSKFMDWTVANDMHCNTSKCKELIMRKRGNSTVYPMSHNIKQYNNISLLGVTIQGNCKFGLHVKAKLHEANKCLFVIRSLRKEGYTQDEIDHLFNSIVIPKLLYGLSVYAASVSELTVIQRFLKRCYKRRYTSVNYNIYELLEKSDRRLFYNLKRDDHPLKSLLPRYKDCIVNLRRISVVRPSINTERFKDSFFNRLIFKYNLAV